MIRKTGRNRIIAEMRTYEANKLVASNSLSLHNLKAYIPTHRSLRTGIIRDISQNFSIEQFKDFILSSLKVLEIHRLNRKIRTDGQIKYVPSRTICIKFTGQSLPQYVNVVTIRH